MSSRSPLARPSRRWTGRLVARLGVAALAAGLLAAPALGGKLGADGSGPAVTRALAPAAAPAVPDDRATRIRVSSFNILGYSHTAKGGSKYGKGWADGRTRARQAVQLINNQRIDVVGLQELQKPQWEVFRDLQSERMRMFPSNEMGSAVMQNSIAWDYTKWYAEQKKVVKIPYFHGTEIYMPYVQLRNRETGRMVWVYNSHNPADVRGDAARWRTEGFRREVALVKRLHREYPGEPVISLGDKNAFSGYHCYVATRSDLRSASGGGVKNGKCVNPARMHVDWVMGSSQVHFTSYQALRNDLVRKTSDHAMLIADATLPSARVVASGIRHVVLVNVSGLSSTRLSSAGASALMPNLARLRREGASTLDARTAYESVAMPANTWGILTSRPVDRSRGGTGVNTSSDRGGPVHRAAGRYVASVFDVAQDNGRRSSFFSSHRSGNRVLLSYDARNGRADTTGLSDGRKKIARGRVEASDYRATMSTVTEMRQRPKAIHYLQLTGLDAAASAHGPVSSQYTAAMRQVDVHLGRIRAAIDASPTLRGRTVVILTADRGGMLSRTSTASAGRAYTVPFVVWGRGVPRGEDLYRINTHYADPRDGRPFYTAPLDPIRNSYAGNLATKLLGLPAIPGSNMDAGQTMSVFSR